MHRIKAGHMAACHLHSAPEKFDSGPESRRRAFRRVGGDGNWVRGRAASAVTAMAAPLLEIRDLTKSYGGGLFRRPSPPALENFSLNFAEGEPKITTIAGESGSGKTTLANLALDFIHPTSGRIFYRGQDISAMSRSERFVFRREVSGDLSGSFWDVQPFLQGGCRLQHGNTEVQANQ